ncbi:MAG: prohibitin family protein [Bacteroidetes bacterium]|nr:MAG: prohibitin family protein [Bacteroidota bacterium]
MTKKAKSLLILAGVIVVILLMFGSATFVTLQPGEKGIIFRKFSGGLDKDHIYNAGFHMIAPWNDMIIYDVREQKVDETMDVLDKKGLPISVDVSVRFYPIFNKIGYLHEKFGRKYVDKLVIPEVRSTVRQVMGRFTAEEIYSTKRSEVETQIKSETEAVLNKPENNIYMTTLLIRSINLPSDYKKSIEDKEIQKQEALAYQYKLEKEEAEAKRKVIAAEGEAKANKIINSSLTSGLLKMRGIEATIKLSESPNSKTIIIGSGKDGLPLILGGDK